MENHLHKKILLIVAVSRCFSNWNQILRIKYQVLAVTLYVRFHTVVRPIFIRLIKTLV